MSNPPASLCLHELQSDQIERVQEDGDTVRWKDLMLLAPGIWTDAGSGEPVLYSQEGIENSANNWTNNTVNFLHERDDELWTVGTVDTDTVHTDDEGRLFADVVLDTGKTAGELADEALQRAMETRGQEGVQGPSVELRGLEYRQNKERGVKELVRGEFNGLALVGVGLSPGPASKTASFAHQTKERAVAMSKKLSDGSACFRTLKYPPERSLRVQEKLREHGIELSDDADPELVEQLADALNLDNEDGGGAQLQDPQEVAEDIAEDFPELSADDVLQILDRFESLQTDEDDEEGEEDDEDEEDEEGMDMEDVLQGIAQLEDMLRSTADELAEQLGELEAKQEQLADAETLQDIEQRLQAIEDTPLPSQSLADDGNPTSTELDPETMHGLSHPRVTIRSEP